MTLEAEDSRQAAFSELVAAAPQLPTWLARAWERRRMADAFLHLPVDDRREALSVAADRSGRPAHLLEKDVWVVWALATLLRIGARRASGVQGRHFAVQGLRRHPAIFRGRRSDLRHPRDRARPCRRERRSVAEKPQRGEALVERGAPAPARNGWPEPRSRHRGCARRRSAGGGDPRRRREAVHRLRGDVGRLGLCRAES